MQRKWSKDWFLLSLVLLLMMVCITGWLNVINDEHRFDIPLLIAILQVFMVVRSDRCSRAKSEDRDKVVFLPWAKRTERWPDRLGRNNIGETNVVSNRRPNEENQLWEQWRSRWRSCGKSIGCIRREPREENCLRRAFRFVFVAERTYWSSVPSLTIW